MFIQYLRQRLLEVLRNEYQIYKLKSRLSNAQIFNPFSIVSPERFTAGRNLLVKRNCFFHCGGLDWSKGEGKISVGDNCWFSENNVLYGAGEIEIGESTGTGPGVMIYSSRDNYSREFATQPNIVHQFGKVKIGSYVRIFSNAIITPGVTISDGAVIGAGAIVTRDIPPWTIALGAPAQVIGAREIDRPISSRKDQSSLK